MMFLLHCIKQFLSLNGKTSQQTKHSSLANIQSGQEKQYSYKKEGVYLIFFSPHQLYALVTSKFLTVISNYHATANRSIAIRQVLGCNLLSLVVILMIL